MRTNVVEVISLINKPLRVGGKVYKEGQTFELSKGAATKLADQGLIHILTAETNVDSNEGEI